MRSALFAKTLRDFRRGLLGWALGVILTVALMAALWPSLSDVDYDALLSQYPDALKDLFNIGDMGTGWGFLNAELFSMVLPAVFIIFAVSRGARLVAGEEEDGTLETLVSLPLERPRILLEKAAALVVSVGALGAALLAASLVSSAAAGMGLPVRYQVNGALSMVLLGTEFGLVSLAIGAATGRRAATVGITSGLAGASYLVFVAAGLVDTLRPLRVLSPFYQATRNGPLGPDLPAIALVMPAVGVLALAIAVPVFNRRDLAI